MRAYQTYTSGNLFAARYLAEKVDGVVVHPPLLFVIGFVEEAEEPKIEPISWTAAHALAPDDAHAIGVRMNEDRTAYEVWAENQRRAALG